MAKIRVHDLAKELGMESKELVDILKSKNIEAKSQSTLEDDVAAQIRKEAAGRKGAEKKEEKAAEKDGAAPKNKKLAFVVRPQNSKNSSRIQGRRQGQGQRPARSAQGNARPAGENRPSRPAG